LNQLKSEKKTETKWMGLIEYLLESLIESTESSDFAMVI